MSQNNSSSENIKCVVRCRPLNSKESGLGTKCITISPDSKVVIVENKDDKNPNNKGQYAMDRVFDETVTQAELFQEIGEPILKNFIGGYNCTIFCYGQTGAGKTHTMMGPLDQLFEEESPSHGLIPRIIHYIFNEKQKVHDIITNNTSEKCKNIKYQVKTCVMEIYQEQIIDLLNPISNSNKIDKKEQNELKKKEEPKKGMYIQGITEAEVSNAKEAKSLILTGLKSRHVAATEMNAESSRSHLLFSIYLNACYINPKGGEVKKSSRLHLVDLAGSERQKKTKAVGERIKEACMINKSLSTLGNVINALVEANDHKGKYIPFRDSKLTYFLKDSLGGNSKTTICANISLSLMQVGETISTLKFVQRAKMIKNSVSLNVSVQENIETLHEEIKKLKAIIEKGGIDLSLLDENKKKEDYICPICHNQPIEVTQDQAMNVLKNDIINLTEAIVKNFAFGDELKKKFLTLDSELGKSGIKFFDLVEQYKTEYESKLKDLGNKAKLLGNLKDGIDETNQKLNEYKPEDPMDRLAFEKIHNLNDTTAEIIKKLQDCDITEFNKLQTENQALRKEIEISTEIKKMLEDREKNKNNEQLSEKEKKISECVDKFVKSNEDIKNFMSRHFLGQPMLKNELVFLEKSKYDLLLFQLDEEKMSNNSLKKKIEEMESENYLINLELTNMKNQLDTFKDIKSSGRVSLKGGSLFSSKSIKRLSIKRHIDDNINNNTENNDNNNNINNIKPINPSCFNPNKKEDFKDDNKNISISNKLAAEILKMKESLEDLNDDLEIKICENEDLQEKILQLEEKIKDLNIKVETEEGSNKELKEQIESLYTENDLYEQQILELSEFKRKTGTEIEELSKDINNSFLLNDNLISFGNSIFDMYHRKYEELFEKNKQHCIKEETLKKELLQKNETIKNLNDKIDLHKTIIDENNLIINEIMEFCNKNNDSVNDIFKNYRNEMEKIEQFYKNVYKSSNDNISDKIGEIIKDLNEQINNLNNNDNNIKNLTDKMKDVINTLLVKLNLKENSINRLNKEIDDLSKEKNYSDTKNLNTINELEANLSKYKNRILEKDNIIKKHLDNEIIIKKTIEEINLQINDNNEIITKLNQKYNEDLSKFYKYYNNIILYQNKNVLNIANNNEESINEIKSLLKSSESEVDQLFKKYNELNDMYYDKCCSLLNNINNQDMESKSLNNKISILEMSNSKLKEQKERLEEENTTIINEKKTIENLNQINIEHNNKLKKNLESTQGQITNLNEEILKYIEQLKKKDDLINELKKEKNILNLQIHNYQNENSNLCNNLESKNEFIKCLQEKINKYEKMLEEHNKKNLDLLKEIEEDKKKYDLLKIEEEGKEKKINELNEKITKLFGEISNKDKIINQHNQEQLEMSKNIIEINDNKNSLLSKMNSKEKELLDLQKINDEMNTKIVNLNEQNNSLLNKCQNKSNEIDSLKDAIQKNNLLLKSKDERISKLNKRLKLINNQKLCMNVIKSKNLALPSFNTPMTPCGLSEPFDLEFEINYLKERNALLLKEKFQLDENQTKLNMKYNMTKILMTLGPQLIKEFGEYKTKNKENNMDLDEAIESFINEKIHMCNNEMKNIQNSINKNSIEKKKINTQLLDGIKSYNESFLSKFNQFISDLNDLLNIFKKDEIYDKDSNKTLPQFFEEIISELNHYIIYEINIGKKSNDNNEIININQIKEIQSYLQEVTKNKKEMITNLIPLIIKSYNIIVKEELNADEQIKYYQNKKQILEEKKAKSNDVDGFISEYNNLINKIKTLKEKYSKLKDDLISYKEKMIYNENLYSIQMEKELSNIKEEKEDDKYFISMLDETNGENDEESKKIINEMNKLKDNIINKKNDMIEIINKIKENNGKNNEYSNFYNLCKNTDFNFVEKEKNLNKLISSRDDLEKKVDDLKLNFLILNTLPNHYKTFKVFINYDVIKEQNTKLINKIKLIFNNNFNIDYIYNDSKPELIWDQAEIPKLAKEIMLMREEKQKVESDLNALKLAFDLALESNGNDSQLLILFKIKEENKKLKKEIQQIKEKNKSLQEKLKELNYNKEIFNSCNKINKINDIIAINSSLNGNSILSINELGNNYNSSNKILRDYHKPNNCKKKLLFTDVKLNNSSLNVSKDFSLENKSKKKNTNIEN